MYDVSIVMPVYNSEKYLRNCIDSVLAQEYDNFELLLVDDGSKDTSGAICDEYAKVSDKVKVIHKKNGGICSARNAGIEAATGEYIGFCDNDDMYLAGLISDNIKLAKDNSVDLMRYAKIKTVEKDDGKIWRTVCKIEDMFIEKKDFHKHYYNIRREDTVWTGFYRRSIIVENNIRFDERIHYGSEDLDFNLKFLKHCNKLGFNSKAYYSWTQRYSHSTSRSFHIECLDNVINNMQLEYEFMNGVCEAKIDDVLKNIFLINVYVYPAIEYMGIKGCDLSTKQKCQRLDEIRKHPIFDKRINKKTIDAIKKKNKRVFLVMMLFYNRRYRLLLMLLNYGTRMMDLFRFKRNK